MRKMGRALIWTLSLTVAGYAVFAYAFQPVGALVHPDIRAAFQARPAIVLTHVFAAVLALLIGPLQFWVRLRQGSPSFHRWSGRVYLGLGVLVGGLAGLYMAFHAYGGIASRLGFSGLALGWLYTGMRAYLSIRARDIAAHRAWLIRNYALTFAAVTLRLYVPAAVAFGVTFETAYPVIAWLCWVPNLVFAHWFVRRSVTSGRQVVVKREA